MNTNYNEFGEEKSGPSGGGSNFSGKWLWILGGAILVVLLAWLVWGGEGRYLRTQVSSDPSDEEVSSANTVQEDIHACSDQIALLEQEINDLNLEIDYANEYGIALRWEIVTERRMEIDEVDRLIQWVRDGNDPADFPDLSPESSIDTNQDSYGDDDDYIDALLEIRDLFSEELGDAQAEFLNALVEQSARYGRLAVLSLALAEAEAEAERCIEDLRDEYADDFATEETDPEITTEPEEEPNEEPEPDPEITTEP